MTAATIEVSGVLLHDLRKISMRFIKQGAATLLATNLKRKVTIHKLKTHWASNFARVSTVIF